MYVILNGLIVTGTTKITIETDVINACYDLGLELKFKLDAPIRSESLGGGDKVNFLNKFIEVP